MRNNMVKGDVIKIRAKIFNPLIGIFLILLFLNIGLAVKDFSAGRGLWGGLPITFFGTCAAVIFFSGLAVEVTASRITVFKLYFYKEVAEFSDVVGWRKASGIAY